MSDSRRLVDLSNQVASLERTLGRMQETICEQEDTIADLWTQLGLKKRWGWNQHLDDDHWNYGDNEAGTHWNDDDNEDDHEDDHEDDKWVDNEWTDEGYQMHECGDPSGIVDPWEDKQWNQTLLCLLNQPRGRTACGVALINIQKLVCMLQWVEPDQVEDFVLFLRRFARRRRRKRSHAVAMADTHDAVAEMATSPRAVLLTDRSAEAPREPLGAPHQ